MARGWIGLKGMRGKGANLFAMICMECALVLHAGTYNSFVVFTENNSGNIKKVELGTPSTVSTYTGAFNVGGITTSPAGDYVLFTRGSVHFGVYSLSLSSTSNTPSTVAGQGSAGLVDGIGTNAKFSAPTSIAMSPDGSYALIADTGANALRKMTLTAGPSQYTVTTIVGSGTTVGSACSSTSCDAGSVDGVGRSSKLSSPMSVDISPDGTKAVIGDAGNYKIRMVTLTPTVTVTTLSGTGSSGNDNGVAGSATFNGLTSVSFSPDGSKILVTDRSSATLRVVITSTGEVSTPISSLGIVMTSNWAPLADYILHNDYASSGNIKKSTYPGAVTSNFITGLAYPIAVNIWRCNIPGHGVVANNNVCEQCPSGKNTGGAGVCVDCGTGTYSVSGMTACAVCTAGTYQATAGQSGCTQCGTGKYSAATGQIAESTCSTCSVAGTSSPQGAPASGSCVTCGAGTVMTPTVATGGIITGDVSGYAVHAFYQVGASTITFAQDTVADVLVVGGGGGGGMNFGGGGGAGAVIFYEKYKFTSGAYTITVGGGATPLTSDGRGNPGADSTITLSSNPYTPLFAAKGGGGGSTYFLSGGSCTAASATGGDGGSGGGAGACTPSGSGGVAVDTNVCPGQSKCKTGKAGGTGIGSNSGGGGGAGADGVNGGAASLPSTGGVGISQVSVGGSLTALSSVFGSAYSTVSVDGGYIAGGGAGSAYHASTTATYSGGLGGGGSSVQSGGAAGGTAGIVNTGSGGGGQPGSGLTGKAGGSGLILIRYALCQACPAGFYRGAADSACRACEAGSYSTGGAAACVGCGAGTYAKTSVPASTVGVGQVVRLGTDVSGQYVHAFYGSGSITFAQDTVADVLVVGGGGGAGCGYSGGGGAGAVIFNEKFKFIQGSYSVTVGNGGAQQSTNNNVGNIGADSSISLSSNPLSPFFKAKGGGGGGYYLSSGCSATAAGAVGGDGGSGGGAGPCFGGSANGGIAVDTNVCPGQSKCKTGKAGGTSTASLAGGGGGAGADGINGGAASLAMTGGAGLDQVSVGGSLTSLSTVFGTAYSSVSVNSGFIAGGGAGSGHQASTTVNGGVGGGGGAQTNTDGTTIAGSAGRANTGSGGGGGYISGAGGAGGSGLILIRYALCQPCSAGFFKAATDSACQACGVGTYSTAMGAVSDATCTGCPANSGQLTGATFCTANVGYYNLGSSLMAYYPFNNGDFLGDVTGKLGSLIASTNAPTSQSTGPWANSYSALFDASSGRTPYFTVPTVTIPSKFTFCLWEYAHASIGSTFPRFYDFGTSTAGADNLLAGIRSGTNNIGWDIYSGGSALGVNSLSGAAATKSAWYHVCIGMGGSTGTGGKIWFNTVATSVTYSAAKSGSVSLTSNYIGKSNWAGDSYWYGAFDEFRIYNRYLSDDEVTAVKTFTGDTTSTLMILSCGTLSGCNSPSASRCKSDGTAVCCAAGNYFREGVDSACQTCSAGSYSVSGAASACMACDTGKASFAGSTSCDVVPAPKITHGGTAGQTGTSIASTSKAYYRFTSTGGANNIQFASDTVCRVLVVAAGGSGGCRFGGGGGAGALIHSTTPKLSAGVSYTLLVGAGGASVTVAGVGFVGGDSKVSYTLSGTTTDVIVAKGGGRGCSDCAAATSLDGGCGGGSGRTSETAGTASTTNTPTGAYGSDGNVGADPNGNSCGGANRCHAGGGGGGKGSTGYAAGVGGSGSTGATGGNGGDGVVLDITGANAGYAAGGGGGCSNDGYRAGYGGSVTITGTSFVIGGAGSQGYVAASSGAANTGSGGGGSGFSPSGNGASGAGADGVIVILWGCPAGYFGASVAACTVCAAGKYSDMGATTCSDCGGSCSSGTKRCTSTSTSVCCSTGQYFVEGTSTVCQPCVVGSYGDGLGTTCITCGTGSWRVDTAAGGVITGDVSGYRVHAFYTAGASSITFAQDTIVDVLVVGGGGGGGGGCAGGGGAGGVLFYDKYKFPSGAYTITVGAGGGGGSSGSAGSIGSDSTISLSSAPSSYIFAAKGGGAGGYYISTCSTTSNGGNGGSGGGGGACGTGSTVVAGGGAATSNVYPGQGTFTAGRAGGGGCACTSAGGGGGAKSPGATADSTPTYGSGGSGINEVVLGTVTSTLTSIFGTAYSSVSVNSGYIAGGGGGAAYGDSTLVTTYGGLGGGGNAFASSSHPSGTVGAVNTGSGGGGGGCGGASSGAAGGSGLILIRYAQCQTCGVGYTYTGGICVSSECVAGKYMSSGVCTDCPGDTYRATTGATAVGDCLTCTGCDTNAATSGSCAAGSTSNSVTCSCNAGYYMSSGTCAGCKTCDPQATKANACAAGSTSDTSTCTCNADYYGDGGTCTGCKACDSHATKANACAAGSSSDTTTCTCNTGYYGDGGTCTECKACDSHATKANACAAGSSSDTSTCTCNIGYYGNGGTCTACAAGTYRDSTGATAQSDCSSCPANSGVTTTGSTAITQCVCNAGYTGSPGSSACNACFAGFYKAATGPAGCTACPADSTTSGTGSTSRTSCSCNSGFSGDASTGTCGACGNGYYTLPGATDCKQCPPHSTTVSSTASALSECLCQGGYYGDPSTFVPEITLRSNVNLGMVCGPNLDESCKYTKQDWSLSAVQDMNLWDESLASRVYVYGGSVAAFLFIDFERPREILSVKVWNGYRGSSDIAAGLQYIMDGFEVWVGNNVQTSRALSGSTFDGVQKVKNMDGISDNMCYEDTTHDISSSSTSYSATFSCALTGRYLSIRQANYIMRSDTPVPPELKIADLEITGTSRIFPNGCAVCPADQYCAGGALDLQETCPDGKYAPAGSSAVGNCVCPTHASTVIDLNCTCDDGYKKRDSAGDLGGWVCDPCVANEYCNLGAATSCPTHATSPELSGSEGACKCNAGYRWSTSATCSVCTDGYYSAVGASVCSQCQAHSDTQGASGSTGISQCICVAGYKKNGNVCDPCVANEYCLIGVVTACPQFSTAPGLSTVITNCVCDAGYYWNSPTSTCLSCPANSYCAAGVKKGCPTNTFSDAMSSKQDQCKCNAGFQCTVRRKVKLSLTLTMTNARFLEIHDSLKQRLATLVGISVDKITLVATSGSRRLLSTGHEEDSQYLVDVHAYIMHNTALEALI